MGTGLNRKRLKRKKRSCALCKPHKTGGGLRWKAKDAAKIKHGFKEIGDALKR
jgi:hypothetical protein